jgi:amidase
VALLLNALAGIDEADPAAHAAAGNIPDDYSSFLKTDALKGKRFGVLRQTMDYHPDVDAVTAKAIEALKAAGAEVIDVKLASYGKW